MNVRRIHPTAVVDSAAQIDDTVVVGAYAVIGPDVTLGEGTEIGPHAVIDGNTTIGRHNKIFPFCSVGCVSQDKKYRNEPAKLVIGDHNVIREYCTISLGTEPSTRIGSHNWILAYVHVAHDCRIGSHTTFVNDAKLAGHVQVDDYATVGVSTKVHQFCRIGEYSFSRDVMLTEDLPPYVRTAGEPAKLYGLNKIGLRRAGFSKDLIAALHRCYMVLFRKVEGREELMEKHESDKRKYAEVRKLIDFVRNSKRGVLRRNPRSKDVPENVPSDTETGFD